MIDQKRFVILYHHLIETSYLVNYLSTHPSLHPNIHPSIYLSVNLICLFVYLWVIVRHGPGTPRHQTV